MPFAAGFREHCLIVPTAFVPRVACFLVKFLFVHVCLQNFEPGDDTTSALSTNQAYPVFYFLTNHLYVFKGLNFYIRNIML